MIKCKGADLDKCEHCARYLLQHDNRKVAIFENPPEDTSSCYVPIHQMQRGE